MTVAQLIEILQTCDPERRVVVHSPGMGGLEQISTVVQEDVGGLGLRMSFEMVRAVRLCRATPGHLAAQGYDVRGEVPCQHDRSFDYSKRPEPKE